MDQLYPMMYYDGKHFYPFAADWSENRYDREIASGLGIYRLIRSEGNWSLDVIKRQMYVARQLGLGHCYFRSRFLTDNTKGLYDFVCDFDAYPALVPAVVTHQPAPTAPTTFNVERTTNGDNISWGGAVDTSDGDYLTYNVYASTTLPVDIQDARNLIATRQMHPFVSVRRPSDEPTLYYAVTAVNRYGKESEPVGGQRSKVGGQRSEVKGQRSKVGGQESASDQLMTNNGYLLTIPEDKMLPEADHLAVLSMQGTIIATKSFARSVNISDIPNGVYELRTLNHKGVTHHIGFFLIKR
jgi:hypothetical protein